MSALVIETAVRISLLVAAAGIAHAAFHRRVSAASRHFLWSAALVCLLLLPALTRALPAWPLPIRVPIAATDFDAPIADTHTSGRISDALVRNAYRATPAAALMDAYHSAPRPSAIRDDRASGADAASSAVDWMMGLTALYALGVLLALIKLALGRLTLWRLVRRAVEVRDSEWIGLMRECARRLGVRREVRLVRSLESVMPMAFGVRAPAILIPAIADTWADERRRAVLLHELAHVRRRDCFIRLLAAIACGVYWMHPGVWVIARRLHAEGELACDDLVLSAGIPAHAYAGHLLELAYTLTGCRASAVAACMARPRQLEGRLLAVLDVARNRGVPAFRARLVILALVGGVAIGLAATNPVFVAGQSAAVQRAATAPVQREPNVAAIAPQLPGTWSTRPSDLADLVDLRLSDKAGSSHGFTIARARLEGLSPAVFTAGGTARFSLPRDAGTFVFEGTFRSGVGGGTYTFAPSASFPADLAKRDFERPTPADQYQLARADIGFAFVDELAAQGYARPTLRQLVQASQHGVGLDSLRGFGQLGYRFGRLETLVSQADHGVTPQYVRELRAQGLAGLTAEDLLRARDHGVSPEYVSELKALGYGSPTLEALIRARDHGISPNYIRDLRAAGHHLSLDELSRARDHGVSVDYIRELEALGYSHPSLETLIRARDHGISTEYVADLQKLGYRLSLEELTRARDHGVTSDEIRELATIGYAQLPLDSVIRLRDHGVTVEYIRAINGAGARHATVDELVSLRERGVPSGRVHYAADRVRRAIDRIGDANVRATLRALVDWWVR